MKRFLSACSFGVLTAFSPLAVAQPTLLVGGDVLLVEDVATELRATGYEVRTADAFDIEPDAEVIVVTIRRVSEQIQIRVYMAERVDGDRVRPTLDESGMSRREETSLRVAESVRSLVEMPPPRAAPARPMSAQSTSAPVASALPDASPPRGTAPPGVVFSPGTAAVRDDVPPFAGPDHPRLSPTVRLGVTSGLGYHNPGWSLLQALVIRGQLSPHFVLGGSLGLVIPSEIDNQGYRVDSDGGTANMFVEWEPLGAYHSWTPAFGGGVRVEYLQFVADSLVGDEPRDGDVLGLGPALRLGVSIMRPVRLRIDSEVALRVISETVVGESESDVALAAIAPTFGLTVGVGFDVGSQPVEERGARRNASEFW